MASSMPFGILGIHTWMAVLELRCCGMGTVRRVRDRGIVSLLIVSKWRYWQMVVGMEYLECRARSRLGCGRGRRLGITWYDIKRPGSFGTRLGCDRDL